MTALEQVIELAASRIGYLEKSRSAYQSDHSIVYKMTDGAGRDNYTECWEDTKPIQLSGIGQGGAWCCNFVYWLFYKLFGKDKAAEALFLNDWKGDEPWQYFSCYAWAGNFEKHNRRYQSSKCQKGDIIYFTKSHTGLVYMVDDTYVYTIEGNTSSGDSVIANGGSVQRKKYKRGIDAIYCYGRPDYSVLDKVEPQPVVVGTACKALDTRIFKEGQIYHYDKDYHNYMHIVELDICVPCDIFTSRI